MIGVRNRILEIMVTLSYRIFRFGDAPYCGGHCFTYCEGSVFFSGLASFAKV